MNAGEMTVSEAKRILPLPALLHREGLGDCAKKTARCPFHEDNHNSFSVYKNGSGEFRFKCFVGCGGGDEINFLEKRKGISRSDATKLFIKMAGGGETGSAENSAQRQSDKKVKGNSDAENSAFKAKPTVFDWAQCVAACTDEHVNEIARDRGYSPEFVRELRDAKQIGIHDGLVAFPVRNDGKIVGVHLRLNAGKWIYEPKGINAAPFVVGELLPGDTVHVFESQWDAFAFMDVSGERSGIIITRGAENGKLVAGLIPAAASVYAWKQNDELKNGKRAGDEWLKHVCEHAEKSSTVKVPKTPAPHKDLNDWTRAGANPDDLMQAMVLAETVREAEVSWIDALNAAVVTSSELHGLELIPRKKLLGDWFCEGDRGFVFVFRGVGKTWLALAIAQALSTGGKLGEWQAPQAVKVLYVDGEMPPDLMRARCNGLQGSNANLEFLNHEILFERTAKTLNIITREIQQAITARCVNSHAKVLILDNLSTLASGMKENESDSWELVNNWLLDLRRRRIAVIVVHHAGRSGEMRGTSRREDNVFWIIALDDSRKDADDKRGARFVSRFTKPSRNTQDEVPAYEWHFITEDSGEVTIGHKKAQTLDVFRRIIEAGVTKPVEIAKEMKLPDYTISRMAKKAIDAGWLRKSRRGEYEIVEGEK